MVKHYFYRLKKDIKGFYTKEHWGEMLENTYESLVNLVSSFIVVVVLPLAAIFYPLWGPFYSLIMTIKAKYNIWVSLKRIHEVDIVKNERMIREWLKRNKEDGRYFKEIDQIEEIVNNAVKNS